MRRCLRRRGRSASGFAMLATSAVFVHIPSVSNFSSRTRRLAARSCGKTTQLCPASATPLSFVMAAQCTTHNTQLASPRPRTMLATEPDVPFLPVRLEALRTEPSAWLAWTGLRSNRDQPVPVTKPWYALPVTVGPRTLSRLQRQCDVAVSRKPSDCTGDCETRGWLAG